MNNTIAEKREALCSLINHYLDRVVSANEFAENYLLLWQSFRDSLWATASSEQSVASNNLVKMRLAKLISAEDFESEYKSIWGDIIVNEENEAIDAIHTACYEFNKAGHSINSEDMLMAVIQQWRSKIHLQ